MAGRRRGGLRPPASVSPAKRRAPRDLLRRRRPRGRQRAEWLAHIPQTNSPSNLPELGQQLAAQANRAGVAERFPAPAVQQSLALALPRLDAYDRLVTALALALGNPAQAHEAQTCDRLRANPGVGKRLALVLLDESHAIHRFPRVQACVAYGRLVTCAKDSAGTRDGPSGKPIGQASRTGAFSDAAVLCRRHHPAGQKSLARVERRQGTGKALTGLAPTRARGRLEVDTGSRVRWGHVPPCVMARRGRACGLTGRRGDAPRERGLVELHGCGRERL
jgi:Transposase IS116/IS110/IS902 family